MGILEYTNGEIHLPERWAVLEEALREMHAEGFEAEELADETKDTTEASRTRPDSEQ